LQVSPLLGGEERPTGRATTASLLLDGE